MSDPDDLGGLESWWQQLRTAALVGTERREVPDLPELLGRTARPGADRAQRLLDAAALGDTLRRAGRTVDAHRDDGAEASSAEETRPVAPPPAVQILELLLTQGPVRGEARLEMLDHWLGAAATAGRIVPPRVLPALLDASVKTPDRLADSIRPVLGERGHWLAGQRADWSAALGAPAPTGTATTAGPIEEVAELRRRSPDGGRRRVQDTWSTDSAADRAGHLAGLLVGLGAADEDLLESALDDRSKTVREQALDLIARLPDSAWSRRMGVRLTPLVHSHGTLRKVVEIDLPEDPDPAGVRDGLVTVKGPGSQRARWLEQVVAGAPLGHWEDLVPGSPGTLLGRLRGDNAEVVLRGLRRATATRGDADWARALLATGWETRLVLLLPEAERDAVLATRVAQQPLASIAHELGSLPTPWGPALSTALMTSLARDKTPSHPLSLLGGRLATALDPAALPAVDRLLQRAGDDTTLRTAMRDVLQVHSLRRSISEAFR